MPDPQQVRSDPVSTHIIMIRACEAEQLTLGVVYLVDEAGDDVRVVQVVVIVRAIDVGRNDAGKAAAVLLKVRFVLDINHALGIRIAKVALVRRPVVDLWNDGC